MAISNAPVAVDFDAEVRSVLIHGHPMRKQ